ncbi:MAG: VOC family protein [Chitinophagaceae bacterium]|nr:VOC family protein [Chitinophagaceae bacterium]
MSQHISNISLIVDDYDEAISYFTQKLQFTLIEDTVLSETKRWVRVAPPGSKGTALLLAKGSTEEQLRRVGNQTGGRVFLFLQSDDFWKDYNRMLKAGVVFIRNPVVESYGTVAVFKDLYGNLWDLVG